MEEEMKVRIPKKDEILGIVESMLGANRLNVRCQDGRMRICRIPGSMRKRIWIQEGDIVLIKPWKIQSEKNGDIIFKYTATQANWLQKKGILTLSY
ncbi:MAG: translation initiation factor eIF-1A [Candidatus Aenigmatarchaeota archaeon]